MKLKITTLDENTASYGYLAEWGLSFYIEFAGRKILFDAGMSSITVENARQAKIDLSLIDTIVLSHGHSDHTGGLPNLLKCIGEVPVVAHPDIWTQKYVLENTGKHDFCGIPFRPEELESRGARFHLSREPYKVTDNMYTTGEVAITNNYEQIDSDLFVKVGENYQPDPMNDDQSLVIRTDQGLVIITGCAHRGIVNTIHHAQEMTSEEHIYAVIGGFHLYQASEDRIDKTIRALTCLDVQKVAPCHCTGFYAMSRIVNAMPNRYQNIATGAVIEI